MQKLLIISLLFFVSCNSNHITYSKAENAFDAGREFIDGTLKGDFKKADFFLLKDSVNQQFLNIQEKEFRLKDKEGRQQLRNASIIIQQVEDIDSTVSIIHFHNSYDKLDQTLKIIKQNSNWLVDYKYSFQKK
jgi:hypothetical protein